MGTIAILGAGYIGKELSQELKNAELVRVDIRDIENVRSVLSAKKASVVINAAGKTGVPNVDWCESHLTETFDANTIGALNVAKVCADLGAHLIHLGSGCVFYGESPRPGGWREDDYANPESTYSRSKYAADLLLSRYPHVAIARLRMPVGSVPHPRNLITKLAAYKTVIDVGNSVTVLDDLVNVMRVMCEKRPSGVFHVVNPGVMRHRDLLSKYKEYVDPKHAFELVNEGTLMERGLIARSRSNCILSSERLNELGVSMRPIDEALTASMIAYSKALVSL